MAEVQMSAWAKDHALSDEVKAFAGKLLDDHTILADQLRSVAGHDATAPIADLDPKDALEIDRQKTLEPNILDRAYMREVMKWHLREAEAYRREIEAGKNETLRAWASRMLAEIQNHIRDGEDTERAIGMEVETAKAVLPPPKS